MGHCCAKIKKRSPSTYFQKPDKPEIENKPEENQDIQINLNCSRDTRELQEIILSTVKTKSNFNSLKASHTVTEKFILNYNEQIVEEDYHPLQAALHPENINRFYDIYFKIDQKLTSGEKFKETLQYYSLISEEELLEKREEFWETRIEGNAMSWQAIRSACEEEDQSFKLLLSLIYHQQLPEKPYYWQPGQPYYDDSGQRFCIPIFCINMPEHYEYKRKPTMIDIFQEQTITVFLRDKKKVNHEFKLSNQSTVEELKAKFQIEFEKNSDQKVELNQICLFYGGKLLENQYKIGEYKINHEYVIQVLIKTAAC